MMELYKANSFKPWEHVTAVLQALRVDLNLIFEAFESSQQPVPGWSCDLWAYKTHGVLSVYKK